MLEVSQQGYYQWVSKSAVTEANKRHKSLTALIKHIFYEHRRRYGSPRVYRELKKGDLCCGENLVAEIMRAEKLVARGAKKRVKTTDSCKHRVPPALNVLNREFYPEAINQVWAGDITYIRIKTGVVYLAVFMDLFSRRIVGWTVSKFLTKEFVLEAFRRAQAIRNPPAGLMVHTDQGSQYTSHDFVNTIQSQQFVLSLSRRGNCWDNAVLESFFDTLKTESLDGHRFYTEQELYDVLLDYIERYYNVKRMHSTLDYLTPGEYENMTV